MFEKFERAFGHPIDKKCLVFVVKDSKDVLTSYGYFQSSHIHKLYVANFSKADLALGIEYSGAGGGSRNRHTVRRKDANGHVSLLIPIAIINKCVPEIGRDKFINNIAEYFPLIIME